MTSMALTPKVLYSVVTASVRLVAAELVQQLGPDEVDSGPHAVPRDLRLWLGGLRLLAGVPFGHLVADAALLPPESIRFFYVDRGWTDSLVEGALSVGTVTTADRSALAALYGTVRREVDEAERLVRLPGVDPGAAVPSGDAGTVSGFLLRSRMVSGWPALHVRGYAVDNLTQNPPVGDQDVDESDDTQLRKLGLLRMERLAPAVLLVLFDGVPAVVHIEEPRAGVQFGVDAESDQASVGATVTLRDPGNARPTGTTVGVPFRNDSPGVIHLGALARKLVTAEPSLGPTLDAAEFAMQMLQFPYRAVFGDPALAGGEPSDPASLFRPTISMTALLQHFEGSD